MDLMVAAREVVTEFVSEQDGEQGHREGQAGDERRRLAEGETKGVKEGVEGSGLVACVGGREVRAGDQASKKGQEKKTSCQEQGSKGMAQARGFKVGPRGRHVRPWKRLKGKGNALVCLRRSHEDLFAAAAEVSSKP